jgi:hypothetical protein
MCHSVLQNNIQCKFAAELTSTLEPTQVLLHDFFHWVRRLPATLMAECINPACEAEGTEGQ